uniref:Uncharacterized protein n=1 Tax=Ditylenchus dipsaci TaxID=166011 RepID=A0A915D3V9_9BILA
MSTFYAEYCSGKFSDVRKCATSARWICTTSPLDVNCAGKYRKTSDRSLRLTYQMARRPTHIGVSKGCMTFHSQNLEGFRQQQPVTIAQDEVVVRLCGFVIKDGQCTLRGWISSIWQAVEYSKTLLANWIHRRAAFKSAEATSQAGDPVCSQR